MEEYYILKRVLFKVMRIFLKIFGKRFIYKGWVVKSCQDWLLRIKRE